MGMTYLSNVDYPLLPMFTDYVCGGSVCYGICSTQSSLFSTSQISTQPAGPGMAVDSGLRYGGDITSHQVAPPSLNPLNVAHSQ